MKRFDLLNAALTDAAEPGLEPRLMASKATVLPLDDSAIVWNIE